jgi:hypothetical protein
MSASGYEGKLYIATGDRALLLRPLLVPGVAIRARTDAAEWIGWFLFRSGVPVGFFCGLVAKPNSSGLPDMNWIGGLDAMGKDFCKL